MCGAFVHQQRARCMKIVSAMDLMESTSHWTVFTALVASMASRRERSITSWNPSSEGTSTVGGTGTGAFVTTSKLTLAVTFFPL